MKDYKTYTNAELEEEMKRLETEYNVAQSVTLENYKLMFDLASQYKEAQSILDMRNGKKREG